MPRKIPFWVVQVTGEDEDYSASELNMHMHMKGPSVKGWQSPRFCQYPQEIILQLEARSRVTEIQILSHQYLIAAQIDIFVGDVPKGMLEAPNSVQWKKFGEVFLCDYASIDHKARQLKSVIADVIGTFVRLVLHQNFINRLNLCNQVGIIALNVIGDKTWEDVIASEEQIANGVNRKEKQFSFDDLAFAMSVDCEVALLMHKLEGKKIQAVSDEKFELAKKIKECIENLQKVGEKLGKMEMEKQSAVDAENYDKAKKKKEEMDEFRIQSYLKLEVTDFLDFDSIENNKREPSVISQDNSGSQLKTPNKFLPPLKEKIVPTKPISASIIGNGNAQEKTILPLINNNNGKSEKVREGFQSAPAEFSDGGSVYLDTSSALARLASSSLSLATNAPVLDRVEMAPAIHIFGLPLVEKLCTKTFLNRESAIQGVLRFLESYTDRKAVFPYEVLDASLIVVRKGLQDKVFSVFTLALELANEVFTSFIYQNRFSEEELLQATKSVTSEILQRIGDPNPRIQSAAIDGILDLLDAADGSKGITMGHLITKSFTNNTSEREAEGHCDLVMKLLQRFNLDTTEWLNAADLMKFGLKALDHESPTVKETAERIILSLYIQVGDAIIQYLPALNEDNSNFKHLWQEIERLDDQGMTLGRRASTVTNMSGSDENNRPDSDRICIFCNQKCPQIAAEGLNTHYWRDCPMLMNCLQCKLVIEISGLTEHLLGECSFRNQFRQCPKCLEAVTNKIYEKHVRAKACLVPKPEYIANRCPLCHLDIPPWEEGWRLHLISPPGCPLNPRGSNYKRPLQTSKFSFFRNK